MMRRERAINDDNKHRILRNNDDSNEDLADEEADAQEVDAQWEEYKFADNNETFYYNTDSDK